MTVTRKCRCRLVGPAQSPHVVTWRTQLAARGFSINVSSLGQSMRLSRLSVAAMIVKAWLSPRPDVVITHSLGRHGLLALMLPPGRRNIVVPWGSEVRPAQAPGFRRWVARRLLRRAQTVITTSIDMAQQISSITPDEIDCRVISWGVDECFFTADENTRVITRTFLGLPESAVLVVAPRGTTETYQHTVIEDAFKIARRSSENLVLISISADSDASLPKNGRSAIIGRVDKPTLARLFQAADLVISIPGNDQRSTAVLEAVAAGVPLVLSDIPAYRELIAQGVTADLISEPNATKLAEAMAAAVPARRILMNPVWAHAHERQSVQFDEIARTITPGFPIQSPQ